ncbi:hypothetical protein PN498_14960 [Oscillatoria sp. CS-180]|uniref:hypothetical protein n=1 Tax=Oscillatoria sp. CS-180 TaxID=3021720 RepID=UPI00232C9AD8|nr:hypothetical protein [Oscillatoria sp. CS-180]MDB9527298.1 hypothetical protein [Oscillatoria sp. CS-180]
MAILNRFLHLLKLIEGLVAFAEFSTTPIGVTVVFCMLSHQALVLMSCDSSSSAVLAIAAALTLHCTVNRPDF